MVTPRFDSCGRDTLSKDQFHFLSSSVEAFLGTIVERISAANAFAQGIWRFIFCTVGRSIIGMGLSLPQTA
jgi:hypothetical protein